MTLASSAPSQPLLDVQALTKSFGDLKVLDAVSFQVQPGDVLGIIGPSGSGKSTLLRCLNFLEIPTDGAIYLKGERVGFREMPGGRSISVSQSVLARQRKRMAMVFQSFNLWPHRTALENVIEGPMVVNRIPRAEAEDLGMVMLKRVGLERKAGQYPARLSGGQQQRVGIARALAMQPDLILFDEPTSALDPELVGEVLKIMRDLVNDGMTMIVVTHEMAFARDACSRVMLLGDGKIVDEGPPDHIFSQSTNSRTRAFLGRYQLQFESQDPD
jgi:polar amino acid transport system ATP-binding protein